MKSANFISYLEIVRYLRTSRRLILRSAYFRYALHSCFWLIMYFFFIYLKRPLLDLSYGETALVVIKDLIVVSCIFYFLSYYVVPKMLLRGKFVLFALFLLVIYYFYATTVYLDFLLTPKLLTIPGRGYQIYSRRIISSGFLGILTFQNGAEIALDLSYLLSPALIVKLLVTIFNLTSQALRLETENVNLELAFLKSQLNPHFLFNTLNNVYSLALQKSDKAPDVILKLSDLMRYTLYESNTEKIALSEEVRFLRNYLELERIRHSDKLSISFDVQGKYDDVSIAPLIIFPFMENAFKHGINASVGSSWVIIKLAVDDSGVMSLFISNKIAPRNSVQGTSGNVGGIGISNTNKRLTLLYSNKHKLDIQESEATFSVNLMINLK